VSKNGSRYDAVIIGAGVGGLICGCYLAKNGMKVLIIEKNSSAGGYCSNIKKNSFNFNLTTFSLGSLGEGGVLNKILFGDLNLKNRLPIGKDRSSTTIVTEDGSFDFGLEYDTALGKLGKIFPDQSNAVRSFFKSIVCSDPAELYLKYKDSSFGKVLDQSFSNERLRKFFTIPCGNYGYSPRKISAFSALIYYKNLILDGSYHIIGGAEKLAGVLSDEFKRMGGIILFHAQVAKILIKTGDHIEGVVLKDGTKIEAAYLVACCDAREVLLKLIGKDKLNNQIVKLIKALKISSSAFIVYLGLKKEVDACKARNVWFCTKYDTEEIFSDYAKYSKDPGYMLINFSSSAKDELTDQVSVCSSAPFMTLRYWEENKESLAQKLIEKTDSLLGNLSRNIDTQLVTTPIDLYDHTLNYRGAMRGWASTPKQSKSRLIPQAALFKNLFLAGQWATHEFGQGSIPATSFSAHRVATTILKKREQFGGSDL